MYTKSYEIVLNRLNISDTFKKPFHKLQSSFTFFISTTNKERDGETS